jgi:hypothetical protein
VKAFLHTLFGDALAQDRQLAIFTLPDKRTRHFAAIEAAAEYASAAANTAEHVYFGLGLAGDNFGRRNCSSDIVAIPGLWADIDMVSPERADKPLPKDIADVKFALLRLPFAPTLLVHSGYGIHAYWLFREPWIFTTDADRAKAAHLAKFWHGLVCSAAAASGWKLENLGDLARVLRLPGTLNRKCEPPVQVQLHEEHLDRRFNPSDFDCFLPKEDDGVTVAGVKPCLVLCPDAEPPSEKFAALSQASPVFAQSWNRHRPDLQDQSQSAYDQSLANIAAFDGWTDQEIANLLIAVRRKHGQNPGKALRQDYAARTISAARDAARDRGNCDAADASAPRVDISALMPNSRAGSSESALPDPGPLPVHLLRIPGFISEVMDYCLATAPYPNQVMAFCGALALQAFLAGRKVRDPGGNRTNLYLLGLAHSAAGKDWPRKINMRVAHRVGLSHCLGDRFASGEGIQDALFAAPCRLFQTDEIDGMLQSINKAKDARHENIMGTLLTMYSAADSVFPMRAKAGKEPLGVIDQPCLVIFGTAIPNHYYEALSERMLTNGFFARMLILESGKRGDGQEPRLLDLPERVLSSAEWWENFKPATGNLEHWHPVPAVVEHAADAVPILIDARKQAESEYAAAEERNDAVATTVWGRVNEHIRKLALLYAISTKHEAPRIGIAAVQWATAFVMHQTRRMLFMAQNSVAETPFDASCLKLMQKLRDAPAHELSHSVLLKRMKIDAKTLGELTQTLAQRGDIEVRTQPAGDGGWPQRNYRLLVQTGREKQAEA